MTVKNIFLGQDKFKQKNNLENQKKVLYLKIINN